MRLLLTAWLAALCVTSGRAQDVPLDAFVFRTPPSIDQALAEPLLREDAVVSADRATGWTEGDARFLLLDGGFRFEMGVYGFRGTRAVVRIDTERKPGLEIRHLAIYIEKADAIGGGAVSGAAPRLLVTAATTGRVQLKTNLLTPADAPPDDGLVVAAAARVERYHDALARETLSPPAQPLFGPEIEEARQAQRERLGQERSAARIRDLRETQRASVPRGQAAKLARAQAIVDRFNQEREAQRRAALLDLEEAQAFPDEFPADQPVSLTQVQREMGPLVGTVLPTRGVVGFTAERIVGESQNGESVLMLIGDVRVIYYGDPNRPPMNLQAERVVIFLDGDWAEAAAGRQTQASAVRGVYLEDNVVATDGQFSVRAPRMYYDLVDNRAVLLEAVLYTFDVQRQIPLYLRAEIIRQTSATNFEAQNAILTSSEFGEPHFALAAERVYIDQIELPSGETTEQFTSYDNTFRVGRTPVFYWPTLAGRNTEIPLRSVGIGNNSNSGPQFTTRWDLFSLLGRNRPEGVDFTGDLDYLGDHRLGTGLDLDYNLDDMFGRFNGYLVPFDDGEDDLGGGRRNISDRANPVRGSTQWQHRQFLRYGIELSLEAAYVSDPTFLEEFFPDEATEARTYETSAYLKKQEEEWAVTLLGTTNLNNFLPQTTTLQTPGSFTEKAPELAFFVEGGSLWDDRLTWFSENSVGRLKLKFGKDTPAERGFTEAQSQAIFGQSSTASFESVAEAAGLPTDGVVRADTRQEIAAPLALGEVDVVPYAVGRVTAYDTNFDEFSGNDDQVRLWGQAGTRAHTEFHRAYPGVSSELLNLNGLRHIVEPSANVYYSSTSLNSSDLPIFDPEVEAINQGFGVTFGLRNTLQTRRGGPGEQRTVDWLVVETNYTIAEDENDPDNPIPRFFDYRPEFSTGGDHFYTQVLWLVTDSLGVTADLTYSPDLAQVVQWRVNATLQHTPRFASFINYQDINVLDQRLITYGLSYRFTTKYAARVSQRIDLSNNESRTISFAIERKLPRWTLSVFVSFDDIRDEQTFGILLLPDGIFGNVSTPVFR